MLYLFSFFIVALPFFYTATAPVTDDFILNEETSKHMIQVLRMQNGEQLQLTDGKGKLFTATITDNNRKRCAVSILQTSSQPRPAVNVSVAISLVKNASRFEWFLEKATEIGISTIIPLICTRTEKQHFRQERMNGILISAMLQSRQTWLPILQEPVKFNDVIQKAAQQQKWIAHCEEGKDKVELANQLLHKSADKLILIGPEGDFTTEEIKAALQNGFIPVALGDTRLRTETAGLVAATLLRLL
jgi:16S rRNA (uracil1498-N3)-methyltransferase